eukprot:3778079-Rhodomonas_salina.1
MRGTWSECRRGAEEGRSAAGTLRYRLRACYELSGAEHAYAATRSDAHLWTYDILDDITAIVATLDFNASGAWQHAVLLPGQELCRRLPAPRQYQVSSTISLRARYAMPGTDLAYAATSARAQPGIFNHVLTRLINTKGRISLPS